MPVVILTGDISTETLGAVIAGRCTAMNKPVRSADLATVIDRPLPAAGPATHRNEATPLVSGRPIVFVVDDDDSLRETMVALFQDDGRDAAGYRSREALLAAYRPGRDPCLLIDAHLSGGDKAWSSQ